MTDLTEIYEDTSGPPRYVARLSRTATGQRTYTVGMSLGGADITPDNVRKLFDLENAVITTIDGPRRSARASGQSVTAQMRRSLILETVKVGMTGTGDKRMSFSLPAKKMAYLTTADLLKAITTTTRSQLVADLSYLVREGALTVEQSKGRHPSRYRLAVAK